MMKTTKVLLSSFVLAGLVSACSNEEIIDVAQNEVAQSGRTQVNLTLDGAVESRMSNGTGLQSLFTANDVLGAVLVDGGYDASSANQVDWTVQAGHVGNNKWAYNAESGKFETAGTTSVGAWLFYTKYNEKMTTTRNGVEFYFPQIQEGAADFKYLENNNINFKITPILNIDGYEGEKMNLKLQYASVYNYLNLKFAFDATTKVTKVQKVILKAKDVNGYDVMFPTTSKIVNTELPVANLSLSSLNPAIQVPNHIAPTTTGRNIDDQNEEIRLKYQALRYNDVNWNAAIAYDPIVASTNSANDVEFLVVDCDPENHTNTAGQGGTAINAKGQYSVYMLMPAGVYSEITLDIYTDQGVYTKVIDSRNEYIENKTTASAVKGAGEIFLRSNKVTVLSDVEGVTTVATNADYQVSDFLKITTAEKNTSTDVIITKTADLINLINGITVAGTQNINVAAQDQIGGTKPADDAPIAAHQVVINKAVMDAIVAKEKELDDDIQLVFEGAKMTIIGEASAAAKLNIHDLTFNNGADVQSGYVKTTDDIVVTNASALTVKATSNVEFGYANGFANDELNKVIVESGATVSVTKELAKATAITELVNNGTFTLGKATTLDVTTLTNDKTFTVDGTLNVANLRNEIHTATSTTNTANLTNNGIINIVSGVNDGIINNAAEAKITVSGVYNNNDAITPDGLLLVKTGTAVVAELNNAVGATITNNADMYCYDGDNTINNLGTIYANGLLSTTYITTNSKFDETSTATNDAAQKMGTIIIENRDQDVSVTTQTQKGYIQYTVKASDLNNGTLKKATGDKFNKVILESAAVSLNADLNAYLKYVKVAAATKLTLAADMSLNEVEFTKNATLLAAATGTQNNVNISKLTVAHGVTVKLPTENALNVFESNKANSKTVAQINNCGTVLVGGNFWTSIAGPEFANGAEHDGIFASGDGNSTAFHWNE